VTEATARRARKAALFTVFWQAVEQSQRTPFLETSRSARSQCEAVQTPSRSCHSSSGRAPENASIRFRLGRTLNYLEDRRSFPDGHAETWTGWWDAVATDPELGPLASMRVTLSVGADRGPSGASLLSAHVAALRAAGFAEVGTLSQHGVNRLPCAIR
jgi:hypothetical protein